MIGTRSHPLPFAGLGIRLGRVRARALSLTVAHGPPMRPRVPAYSFIILGTTDPLRLGTPVRGP